MSLVIEMFTDEQVMQYAGGTTLKKKIVGEMQMYTRRGGNGCVGVWCICDQTTGASLGSIALLPLPTDKDDTNWGQLIEDQLPASQRDRDWLFFKTVRLGKRLCNRGC